MSAEQEREADGRRRRWPLPAALVAMVVIAALVTMIVLDRRTIESLRNERDLARSELAEPDAATADPSEEASPAPASATEATEATEQPSGQAGDARPNGTAGRGCSPGTYRIGYHGPISGDYAALGENMINGVDVAVQQANQGRLLATGARLRADVRLEVLPLDSQGDPRQAPELADSAVNDKRLLAVVGPAFSGESMAAGPIYEAGRLPFVTPSATVPALKRQGWSNFFRIVGDDEDQARAIGKFMVRTLGIDRAVIIDDGAPYGAEIADGVEAALQSKGVRVAFREVIEPLQRDYSEVAKRVRDADVDAVFYGGYYQEAGTLRGSLSRAGAKQVAFVSDDGAFDFAFFDAAGSSAGKSYVGFPGIDVVRADAAFSADYFETFDSEPGAFSVEAYMAATLIIDAVAEAGCRRGAIRKHLAGFEGAILGKPIAFDKSGHIAKPKFTFYAVGDYDRWLHEAVVTP